MSEDLAKLLHQLKARYDLFEAERAEIRMDFLIRGICDKEVDGLLEDPGLYSENWLPPHLRWPSLKQSGNRLFELLNEAAEFMQIAPIDDFSISQVEKVIKEIE
ncbi:hypothetical protein [Bacillus niameyensis]|uniref:hypothetical protein n=1 Tax=Bacillus niameyensis TaxID=1522308 RepID=UPI000782E08F|nr:hypothetical protein [Bacillus niameyensis]